MMLKVQLTRDDVPVLLGPHMECTATFSLTGKKSNHTEIAKLRQSPNYPHRSSMKKTVRPRELAKGTKYSSKEGFCFALFCFECSNPKLRSITRTTQLHSAQTVELWEMIKWR